MNYEINLDRAYAIRAEMTAHTDTEFADRSVPASAVAYEIKKRNPDLPHACAGQLVRRIFDHWGLPGLDYHEAPRVPGFENIRAWYPVHRDGRLQRVAPDELTEAEFVLIQQTLREQGEVLHARAEELLHEASYPPSKVAQVAERVPMVQGRLDRRASTATGYAWLVWEKGFVDDTSVLLDPALPQAA